MKKVALHSKLETRVELNLIFDRNLKELNCIPSSGDFTEWYCKLYEYNEDPAPLKLEGREVT